MQEQQLVGLTVARASRLIKARRLSPVELVRATLARVERLQPRLGAFITVTAETALRQARKAEKEIANGDHKGPLHGVPITLKDLFSTKGIKTTAGSKILEAHVPKADAPVTARLARAGAVLIG
jgi:aspartyl-tRNA(Asn)/glutamyl-tRNA(Gln) amidotransferase subunit A